MSSGALLYVNPLLSEMDPRLHLSGYLVDEEQGFDPLREVVQVKWDNFDIPQNQNAHDAMMELDRLLHAYPGTPENPTDVVAHSAGSEVCDKWARERGPDSDIDPATVRFWITGDPEQCFTGVCYLYTEATPPVYPGDPTKGGKPHNASCPTPAQFHGGYGIGYGLPPVCPWTFNVISNQYDGWSMAPLDTENSEIRRAQGISFLGLLLGRRVWDFTLGCLMKQQPHNHTAYEALSIVGGPEAGVFTYTDPLRPTVKHWYVRNYPVPSLVGRLKFLIRDLDMKRRPILDAAFGPFNPTTRKGLPVTITPPDYDAIAPSWFSLF